jgi:flagellar protein FliO/FliZ
MPVLTFFFITFSPAMAWAAEPPDMASALLRTAWALLVVVGLILALYGLSKKRLLSGKMGGNDINIIAMRPLQPKSTLAIVEVRGREYLLGISTNSIHLLAELPAEPDKKKPDFSALLSKQQ